MNKRLIDIIGWYGFFGVFAGYLLVSFGFVSPRNLIYILLNLTGSIGLGLLTLRKKDWSLTIFYFIWAGIGLIKLILLLL